MQCDGSVGWGNHPDEDGEVTLDAMIMGQYGGSDIRLVQILDSRSRPLIGLKAHVLI